MKNKKSSIKIICAALSVLLLLTACVFQFLPFWSAEGDVSISAFVWFPKDHAELNTYFKQEVSENFNVQSLVLYSIIQICVPIAAILVALAKQNTLWLAIGAGITGVSGVWRILRSAAVRDGRFWVPMLIVSILLILVASLLGYLQKGSDPDTL